MDEFLAHLPSPFYRATVKALIFDEQHRLLVVQNDEGEWEIPGGGWEHTESLEACVARELAEELHAAVKSVGTVFFTYRGRNKKGYMQLRLAVPVELASLDVKPGDEMVAFKFVTHEEFLKLPFGNDEGPVTDGVDLIWPA